MDEPSNNLHEWVAKHAEQKIKSANEHDPSTMLVALSSVILMGTSDIFSPRIGHHDPEEVDDIEAHFNETIKKYDNDYCLFEVCCYMLYKLDVWLFLNNYSDFREKQFPSEVVKACLFPFIASIKGDNIYDAYNARLEAFGRLLREVKDPSEQKKREQMLLLQLIYESERVKKISIGDLSSHPHLIRGMTDAFMINTRILTNEESHFPTYTKFIIEVIRSIAAHARIKN